jgi:hypothetical protein
MKDKSRAGSFVAAAVSLLACAVCPVCISVYAGIFSVVGVSFALSEQAHGWVLMGSLLFAEAIAIWAATRHGKLWPPVLTALGGATLLFSHFVADHILLDVAGTALVFTANVGGGRLRRHAHGLEGSALAVAQGDAECGCGHHHSS